MLAMTIFVLSRICLLTSFVFLMTQNDDDISRLVTMFAELAYVTKIVIRAQGYKLDLH